MARRKLSPFNEDIKQRYISLKMKEAQEKGISNKDDAIKDYNGYIFGMSRIMEDVSRHDVCSFTKEEILRMYFSFFLTDKNELLRLNRLYKEYTDWAIRETDLTDGVNHFTEVNEEDLSRFVCINVGDM